MESFKKGKEIVKQDRIDSLYKEVADEVDKLEKIICSVSEDQDQNLFLM